MQTRLSDLMAAKVLVEGQEPGHVDAMADAMPFHAKSIPSCLDLLQTRLSGLTKEEVEARRKQYGRNASDTSQLRTVRTVFLNQFKRLVVVLLFVAAVLSFVMHDVTGCIAILSALVVNIFLNALTQWQGQKKPLEVETLRAAVYNVKRGGQTLQIPSADLVPGDILLFSSGDILPVDARLIASDDLQMDESLVTGESVLVRKDAEAELIPDQDVTEQATMVFAGCRVKTGKGEAVVTATGNRTVMGQIAQLSQQITKRDTSLTRGLNVLGTCMFGLVVLLTAILTAVQLHRGEESMMSLIQFGIILIVAAIPEFLPALATFLLNQGVRRLFKRQVLVKNVQAMESIGNVSVLCSDKTGTLTENNLTVHSVFAPGLGELPYNPAWRDAKEIPSPSVEGVLQIARFNNSTIMEGLRSAVMGDPIDVALYRASSPMLERGFHRVREIPFCPETLRTATVLQVAGADRCVSMIKGAPEAVMSVCSHYMRPNGEVVPIQTFERNEFLLQNQDMALERAFRVIGFAQKGMLDPEGDPYEGSVFMGWVCLVDPPKAGVLEALRACHKVGVRVVMVTGDQKATAAVTARELGILSPDAEVWTRSDLDRGITSVPKTVQVFARTRPEEKLAIVQSLQNSGDIVAMVGDGMNDTPALQKSDIAIAMGQQGTDAAKESSDILLLNDRLEGIVAAIVESRILTNNIKLCAKYLLSCNLGVVFFLLTVVLLGLDGRLPLNALQVLWLNMVIVSVASLTLAFKPGHAALLKAPPPPNHQGPMAKDELVLVLFWSALIMAAGLGVYLTSHLLFGFSPEVTHTLAFCGLAFAQIFHLINIHLAYSGGDLKTFAQDVLHSPAVWLVTGLSVLLQFQVVYQPWLQSILKTTPPELWAWTLPLGFAVACIGLSVMLTEVDPDGP